MATIGRHRAVAQIGRFECSGVLAWWLWLVVHIMALVDFRRRFAVLVEFAGHYTDLDAAQFFVTGHCGVSVHF